ncbi:MAG: GNAT family N-acetyltransferase [Chloroflexi bacterium]|nr:GNAT family N-acetyltransferase [Chloroflexota bacterium]
MSSSPWQKRYASKLRTATAAMSLIRRGDNLFVSGGPCCPGVLLGALREWAERWDRDALHLYVPQIAPLGPEESPGFRVIALGPLGDAPRGDAVPASTWRLARLFAEGAIPLDVALVQVTPPDAHGFCSLGPGVDVARAAAEHARQVIAEVNAQLPWTWGDSVIHVDRLAAMVEHDAPLPEYPAPAVDETARRIARYLARLIPDEATLQAGAGPISAALMSELGAKRDLGLHTDVLTEGMLDLIESGAITNRAKSQHVGKAVCSRCLGTRRLYEYIHDNPLIEFRPAHELGDPESIRRNHRMVAINEALWVALDGTACVAQRGEARQALDDPSGYPQGAAGSPEGCSVVALPSRAEDGASRILPHLPPDAVGVVPGDHIHHIVTEHGVADLYGRTRAERALELVSVAAPEHREELLKEAIRLGSVPAEARLPIGEYPHELETVMELDDGLPVRVRPVRLSDQRLLRAFFYAISEQSLYYRFFRVPKTVPPELVQRSERIDYEHELTLLGLLQEGPRTQVIAVSRYVVDPATQVADVALLVRDDYQRQGLGSQMLIYIGLAAQRRGCVGLKADILTSNTRALGMLRKSGYAVETQLHEGYYTISYRFPCPAPKQDAPALSQGSALVR